MEKETMELHNRVNEDGERDIVIAQLAESERNLSNHYVRLNREVDELRAIVQRQSLLISKLEEKVNLLMYR